MAEWTRRIYLAAITVLAVAWVFNLPLQLGWGGIILEQFLLLIAGLVTGAGFLQAPFGKRAGALELALAVISLAVWTLAAVYSPEWITDPVNRPFLRWGSALVAIGLLFVSLYQNVGLAIAATMGLIGLYGFVGHWFPGVLEGQYTEPRRLLIYLYYDSNGVPGIVLNVATTIVLSFIIFSKALDVAGAGKFFDDISMALLGTRRGGPAKVAVVSSAMFGTISGSAVANVVSSGIVTIPLMIRSGFRPAMAAGIEASSSTAGQFTPPVMGATAFLIAEFLQIPYSEVVIAAAIPAGIFYLVMYFQIDSYAARNGLHGLPRSELPKLTAVLADGWIYIAPIALLLWLMFAQGMRVERAAIYSSIVMVLLGLIKRRSFDWKRLAGAVTVGVGAEMVPILLVSAAAGVVIGTLNISGLAFTITLLLSQVGANAGIFVMLLITAGIALVMGMGLPTSAVYVLLSIVLAPALVKMGIEPLAGHMFIFYLGMMSFLTPPVAISSYTAAGIAKTDMWTTSVDAIRIGASGYLLPFLFVLNPALLLYGSTMEIVYAISTVVMSGAYLSWAAEGSVGEHVMSRAERAMALALAVAIGTSTLWLGRDSVFNLAVLGAGLLLIFAFRRMAGSRARAAV
ncbi:MAG TPA: TRAP transporter fused permease subunit [Xanthobacteraceae bacterium]|nr:TRAP transporter fused permease subunit [Xanthobacteraceae bacterium]